MLRFNNHYCLLNYKNQQMFAIREQQKQSMFSNTVHEKDNVILKEPAKGNLQIPLTTDVFY